MVFQALESRALASGSVDFVSINRCRRTNANSARTCLRRWKMFSGRFDWELERRQSLTTLTSDFWRFFSGGKTPSNSIARNLKLWRRFCVKVNDIAHKAGRFLPHHLRLHNGKVDIRHCKFMRKALTSWS